MVELLVKHKSLLELFSWLLALCAVISGIVMKADIFSNETIKLAGFIVGLTTGVNQFIITSILKKEKKKNGYKK
jgi:hypothetical protein